MTTQVEKAIPEPAMEPVPTSPSEAHIFQQEMLSPVSKLELARKYAAEEQSKRVSAACERMVVVKKAQIVKKLEIEASLETHIEQKIHDHENGGDDAPKRGGRLSAIAMRLVGAFKTTSDDSHANAETHKHDGDEQEATSPTRQLLHATRNKLNALAASQDGQDGASLPATNYHLKQLGLTDDKINIYAPLHEQQHEIRRRRESAIRCQEKYMQEMAEFPADDDYKSAEDSDYAPEDDDDEDEDDEGANSDSDDDDDDEGGVREVEADADEVRRLLEDQSAFSQSVATIQKHKKQSKKALVRSKRVLHPVSILGAILALVLALVMAIFIAEQQSGFCRALLVQEPRAEEVRIVSCNVVVGIHDALLRAASVLSFQD